jgi:hypothetical protein
MKKDPKHQATPGNRTGVGQNAKPRGGREGALPIREPAPGERTQPRPEDEHRAPERR